MSVISTNIGASYGGNLRVSGRQAISQAASNAAGFSTKANAVDSNENLTTVSRHDMLAMNAGVDSATRTVNSLTTAQDAIGVIGGVLGNIQAVLTAATPDGGPSIDAAKEQDRIDSAITTINAIATSAQFSGQSLLNGTFSLTSSAGSISLPSFTSSTLGSATDAAESLDTLKSGGTNELASGNYAEANQIVATALSQISTTQIQITGYLAGTGSLEATVVQLPNAAVPGDATTADAMYTTAAQMLNEPSLASLAAANSSSRNVLTLLQP